MKSRFVLQSMILHERILLVTRRVHFNRTFNKRDPVYTALFVVDNDLWLMILSLKDCNPKKEGMLFDLCL